MIPEYKQFTNLIALSQIPREKELDVPSVKNGVGEAKTDASVPILIFTDMYEPIQQAVVPKLYQQSFEKVMPNLKGVKLDDDDFNMNEFWLGGELAEVY